MAAAATPRPSAVIERDGATLAIRGALDADGVAAIWRRAMQLADEMDSEISLDASGVDVLDGSGAALLVELRRRVEARGGHLRVRGLAPAFEELLTLLAPSAPRREVPAPAARSGPIVALGRATLELLADLRELVAYVGQLALGLAGLLRRPRDLRVQDAFLIAERAGVGAVPIMALIGFLLGLILSFQSAIPMQRFGAQIFIADLLGISLLRELGPLMAAILLTARSGSAFAAEIGTMKVNEEVDALTTMGIEPLRFLVLPRVVAAVAVVPILAMVVNIAGLAGGAVVFRSLGFPLVTFVNRVVEMVSFADFAGGLAKALVFGLIVAAVGCERGLRTGKGAAAVGASTTSSVVSGITLIAIADGVFAVLFYLLGI